MLRSFVALAGVALLASCTSASSPPVQFDGPLQVDGGQNSANAANGGVSVTLSKPYEFPFRTLCTTGKPIKITKVVPWQSDGKVKVIDWGVRFLGRGIVNGPNPMGAQSTVSAIQGFTTDPVAVPCGNSSPDHTVQQFFVSLTSSSPTRTTIKGVTVYYGDNQAVNVQFALAFCKGAPQDDCALPKL